MWWRKPPAVYGRSSSSRTVDNNNDNPLNVPTPTCRWLAGWLYSMRWLWLWQETDFWRECSRGAPWLSGVMFLLVFSLPQLLKSVDLFQLWLPHGALLLLHSLLAFLYFYEDSERAHPCTTLYLYHNGVLRDAHRGQERYMYPVRSRLVTFSIDTGWAWIFKTKWFFKEQDFKTSLRKILVNNVLTRNYYMTTFCFIILLRKYFASLVISRVLNPLCNIHELFLFSDLQLLSSLRPSLLYTLGPGPLRLAL